MLIDWLKKLVLEKWVGRAIVMLLTLLGGYMGQTAIDPVIIQDWLTATQKLLEAAAPLIIAWLIGTVRYSRALYSMPPAAAPIAVRQYTGVIGTKTLIRWLYPRAVAAFDGCSKTHDDAYNQTDMLADNWINWADGDSATVAADGQWLECALLAAGDDEELIDNAHLFHTVIRVWGIMRARLWKRGVTWKIRKTG